MLIGWTKVKFAIINSSIASLVDTEEFNGTTGN